MGESEPEKKKAKQSLSSEPATTKPLSSDDTKPIGMRELAYWEERLKTCGIDFSTHPISIPQGMKASEAEFLEDAYAHSSERRKELLKEGRCLSGGKLPPGHCDCTKEFLFLRSLFKYPKPLPQGVSETFRPDFERIQLAYGAQRQQSHAFDIDDFPGPYTLDGSFPAWPLDVLSEDFKSKFALMMELAALAIEEYNKEKCNVFKYAVKKIEKVNIFGGRREQYHMTVKAQNLTLGTPIETFQIHAGLSVCNFKVVYCCRPREEGTIGLTCCHVCFGQQQSK